jgi:hypothetical protein
MRKRCTREPYSSAGAEAHKERLVIVLIIFSQIKLPASVYVTRHDSPCDYDVLSQRGEV